MNHVQIQDGQNGRTSAKPQMRLGSMKNGSNYKKISDMIRAGQISDLDI